MKASNPLAAAIVIAIVTALVVLYAFMHPEQTVAIIIIYLATIIALSFIVYFINKMYGKLKTSVDAEDFAEITGIEFISITKDTTISNFKQQLRNNELYFMINKALR